jgi:Nucleotidyl transferase AbiEii toxin, Type IV TA system
MAFAEGTITFKEFVVKEPLLLSAIQEAVLEFLQGRDDAVVYGAQAVNAYVDEPRMTQDVDILSTRARELADELCEYLHAKFRISVRVRVIKDGLGFRLYQVRKPKNRHLVDVRLVDQLPASKRIARVLVMAPDVLVASKVIALHRRRGKPKAGTDWRDVAMLLLAFPNLKRHPGPVTKHLIASSADSSVLNTWKDLVSQELSAEEEDDEEGF